MNPRKIEEKILEVWRSLGHISADYSIIVDHSTADYLYNNFGSIASIRTNADSQTFSVLCHIFCSLWLCRIAKVSGNLLKELPDCVGRCEDVKSVRAYANQLSSLPEPWHFEAGQGSVAFGPTMRRCTEDLT